MGFIGCRILVAPGDDGMEAGENRVGD